ncbi:MAG: bifunctional DNA primase/polymerase [Acidimicrobiia bacterium]
MSLTRDDHETEPRPGPAAMAASRRGWSVVPLFGTTDGRCHCGRPDCPSAGKHPRVRWERYQSIRAADSTVRRWWQRWPDANVGVVTGSVSDLVVVDVDPRHGGDATLADLEALEGRLPTTVEAFSGGGGLHLYFAHPGTAVLSGVLGPGLDVKADGGLVVAPPSRHPSGHRYEWEPGASPDEVAPAPVPAWVVERLRAGTSRSRRADGPGVALRSSSERREFAACWSEVGVALEPGDRYYLCPFHDDHRPSLHVDAEGCRWYCFGCRRGGGPGMLRRLVRGRTRNRGSHEGGAHGVERSREPTVATRPRHAVPAEASWMQWPGLRIGGHQDVVGEAACVDALEEIAGGRTWIGARRPFVTATLVPEDDNPNDAQAVRVDVAGFTVGWIPRARAARARAALVAAERAGRSPTARARLTGGWDRGPFGRGSFGVVLDVAPGFPPSDGTEPFIPAGVPVPVVVDASEREALRSMLGGERGVVAALEEVPGAGLAAARLVVRVRGAARGRLDPAAASRYLPLVHALRAAGLPATCAVALTEHAGEVVLTCSLADPDRLLEQ